MPEILKSFTFDDLPMKPPITGRPKVSDDLQQTIALLSGWDGVTRRLVRVSPTGAIRVGSARAVGIINVVANTDAYTANCTGCAASEVMIRAFPDNTGRVFLNIGTAAALNTGYPLFTGEWVSLSVNDMSVLYLYIEKDTDKVAVIFTE
ncbi:unnamed protein product [marine sediment metagenome]|uniref:Uncharacterized protein n=1 Tax=marine sediment metagenome TaxID=412755 RepID=X0ZJU0_9ZZZZ